MLNEILGYIALFFMGVSLGIFGSGGAILTIPILTTLFSIPLVASTSYSFAVVGLTSLQGFFLNRQLKIFPYIPLVLLISFIIFLVRIFFLPEFLAWGISKNIDIAFYLRLLLSGIMLISAYQLLFDREVKKKSRGILYVIMAASFVGVIVGFLGIGGGFILVPLILSLYDRDFNEAKSLSLFIIAFNSAVGFASDYFAGVQLNFSMLLYFFLFSSIGNIFGIYISKKINSRILKKFLGLIILVLAFF